MEFKTPQFNRNNDLTNVFDQRYQANHGNNERIQQQKKDFNRKMFGIRDKEEVRKEMREAHSVQNQVKNLSERMNNMYGPNRNNFGG